MYNLFVCTSTCKLNLNMSQQLCECVNTSVCEHTCVNCFLKLFHHVSPCTICMYVLVHVHTLSLGCEYVATCVNVLTCMYVWTCMCNFIFVTNFTLYVHAHNHSVSYDWGTCYQHQSVNKSMYVNMSVNTTFYLNFNCSGNVFTNHKLATMSAS